MCHSALEPTNCGLKPLWIISQINFSSFNFECQIFCLSNEKSKTEFGTREVVLLLWLYLTIWFRSLRDWLVGRVWKGSEMPAAKVGLECLRQYLMGESNQSLEDWKAEKIVLVKTKFGRFLLGKGLCWLLDFRQRLLCLDRKFVHILLISKDFSSD